MPYVDDKTYEGPETSGSFMKLQPGLNQIRVASPTFHFKKHQSNVNGKFTSTICEGENCSSCMMGDKPKNRYAWIIIDRKDNQVKIMESGWSVYEQMLALAKDAEYGELTGYDLKITKKGEALDTSYSVVAVPSTIGSKITKEEQEEINKSGVDLEVVFGGGKYGKVEEPSDEITEEDMASVKE